MNWAQEVTRAQGYIDTMGGRRQHKPKPQYDPATGKINDFLYKMLNKLIQGTAADIMKIAMIKVFKELQKRNLKTFELIHQHQIHH